MILFLLICWAYIQYGLNKDLVNIGILRRKLKEQIKLFSPILTLGRIYGRQTAAILKCCRDAFALYYNDDGLQTAAHFL